MHDLPHAGAGPVLRRLAESRIREAMDDTPVVLVVGPRRAGKTTLVRQIDGEDRPYFTLDDLTTLDAARTDPAGFVRGLDRATIDEVQRVPELLLAIKKAVDDDHRPGRFLLTGSANVMTLPKVADSLAGRMETIRLLPLAQAELAEGRGDFLDRLYEGRFQNPRKPIIGDDLVRAVLEGGFPEAVARPRESRRLAWLREYLDAVLNRDLRDIAHVERLTDLPAFVRLVAHHAGQLVNFSEIGRSLGISHKTSQRYVALLEQIFLVGLLQPWYSNGIKRLIRSPKLHFFDTGVLAASLGLTHRRVGSDRSSFGTLLESFVFGELSKLLSVSETRARLYHFRDQSNREVDFVVEWDDGRLAGVEVKASATVTHQDFRGLRTLGDAVPGQFASGVVLYDGSDVVPFGKNLTAVPLACLAD